MTELEELELAAKAAGIEVTAVVAEGVPHRFGGGYWNPRLDKAEALDLASHLNMSIRFDNKCVYLDSFSMPQRVFSCFVFWGENEESKTVCEAITRVAALYQKAREENEQ